MSTPLRLLAATASTFALSAGAVAAAADAPVVSKQQSVAGTALVTVPGTGVHKGDWMGSRAVLVFRDVTLEGRQRVRVTLRAPQGKRLRGLATAEGERVAFVALDRRYAGKRRVVVRASLSGAARLAGEHTGRIYALAR
jgi:opacity protein-like surface antigen